MAAVDDLTELVERAAAAERAALSAKWKDRADVEGLTRKVEKAIKGQREELVRALESARSPSGRWARLGQAYLDLGIPSSPALNALVADTAVPTTAVPTTDPVALNNTADGSENPAEAS